MPASSLDRAAAVTVSDSVAAIRKPVSPPRKRATPFTTTFDTLTTEDTMTWTSTSRATFTLSLLASLAAACSDDPAQPAMLELPGTAYYPENISASAKGTLFVGSLTTGQVIAFDDGKEDARVIVGAGSGVTGVTGVHVEGDTLWLCSIDTMFQRPTELRSFTLDGTAKGTFSLGANRFCNDLAFDDAGNVYVTDSFSGTILRLAAGAAALEPWLVDPSLAPGMAGAFGLDGIAFDGDAALYVNRFDSGGLYRVAIKSDGGAGAVTAIGVTPALGSPDGMRTLDAKTLLVVEGAGRLSKVSINGATATATAIADDLDMPTGVVKARGAAWVTEGQLGRLFAMPPQQPLLPFAVRRIEL